MALTSSVVQGKDAAEFATNLDVVVGALTVAVDYQLVMIQKDGPYTAVVTK